MKKLYIQPETEITSSFLKASLLDISLRVGNIKDPSVTYEGDDNGSHIPEVNNFKLWEE